MKYNLISPLLTTLRGLFSVNCLASHKIFVVDSASLSYVVSMHEQKMELLRAVPLVKGVYPVDLHPEGATLRITYDINKMPDLNDIIDIIEDEQCVLIDRDAEEFCGDMAYLLTYTRMPLGSVPN